MPLHVPVMLEASLAALAVRPGGVYLDATFGAGGHTRAIVAAGGRVIAFDRDRDAAVEPDLADRVHLVHGNFADLSRALDELDIAALDGALFDVGVSSMQLDVAERGFSFASDGPLDMRMNRADGSSAYDVLAGSSESELADIIFRFGEERAARRIARAIVSARSAGRLPQRTGELARLVAGVLHVRGKRERLHPATRTFQALRIAVNDELGSLERGLDAAIGRTLPGGRIAVITFHSLEDRIAKVRFRDDDRVRPLTKKPLLPGDEELAHNPRSRSAKLRVAERMLC